MTLEAVVVPKVMILAAVNGAGGGTLDRCFPPRPSMMMKAITFGIHATLSYLEEQLKAVNFRMFSSAYEPVDHFVTTERNLGWR